MVSELRRLVEALPGLVWTARPDGSAEFLSHSWRDYTGMALEEIAEFGWRAAIHPTDLPILAERWGKLVESGNSGDIEARLRRHDGEYRWFRFSCSAMKDKAGRIVKWCGVNTDIEEDVRAKQLASEVRQAELERPGAGAAAFEQMFRVVASGGVDVEAEVTSDESGLSRFLLSFKDLAESRLSEAQLRATVHQLNEAQRLSRTGSASVDVLADEHAWSNELYRITEIEPGTPINFEIFQRLILPEDRHIFEKVIDAAQRGIDSDFVLRIATKSGTVKHLRGIARLANEFDGRPVFIGALQDVTDHKRAEEALRASEAAIAASERELRLIVDTIPGMVAVFSASGELEAVNDQVLQYFGGGLERQKDWDTNGHVHPEDNLRVVETFTRSIAAGEPFELENRARRHDGAYRWFHSRVTPLKDANGRVVRWYNLLIDIDDRKRAETELRQAQYFLTEAQRLSQTGSFTWDPSIDEEKWSEEIYRIFDLDPATEVKLPLIRQLVHPEDLPLLEATIERGMAGLDMDITARIVTPRGVTKHVHVIAHRMEHVADRPVFVGAIQDVTHMRLSENALKGREAELKRSEAFLAEGQRLSSTGTFLWYPDSNEMTFSEELYRIHEIDPGLPMDSALHMSRTHPDDVPLVYATATRFQREGGVIIYESRLRMPDGRIKHVSTFGREIVDQDGRRACLGVCQDLTAKKLAEEALNKARTELAHVARVSALGELTASIAHEVNQPLAGIMTNADICLQMLAIDPPDIDEVRATAQRTLRDGARASEVIKRLRAMFSRKEPTSEPVDLCGAAREVLALSAGQLQAARVSVRTEFPDDLPTVLGDRIQLQQVILNLVLNAADAMRQVEQTRRSLLLAAAPDRNEQIVFSVRDVGVGLGAGNSEKVFETFYTTKPEGMGIGLSVSRSIVERHGGSLWASSNEDGPGATFRFAIPCAPAPAPASRDHTKSKRGRSGVNA
jgi:PAS domain S-box-containing protein